MAAEPPTKHVHYSVFKAHVDHVGDEHIVTTGRIYSINPIQNAETIPTVLVVHGNNQKNFVITTLQGSDSKTITDWISNFIKNKTNNLYDDENHITIHTFSILTFHHINATAAILALEIAKSSGVMPAIMLSNECRIGGKDQIYAKKFAIYIRNFNESDELNRDRLIQRIDDEQEFPFNDL